MKDLIIILMIWVTCFGVGYLLGHIAMKIRDRIFKSKLKKLQEQGDRLDAIYQQLLAEKELLAQMSQDGDLQDDWIEYMYQIDSLLRELNIKIPHDEN